jgi:DNA-binding PadR family transcriptional regulator
VVDRSLTQEDVLLLLADGATGPFDLDPIRIMKGAFLVSQRGRQEWKSLFHFQPYAYGPFDASVYGAVERLVVRGLLEKSSERRYDSYGLTDEGRLRVEGLNQQLGTDADWIRSVGEYVTSRPFAQLLQEVYSEFPKFAARSVAHV